MFGNSDVDIEVHSGDEDVNFISVCYVFFSSKDIFSCADISRHSYYSGLQDWPL